MWKKYATFLLSISALSAVVAAACLSVNETTTIEQLANATNISSTELISLFEELCNKSYSKEYIDSSLYIKSDIYNKTEINDLENEFRDIAQLLNTSINSVSHQTEVELSLLETSLFSKIDTWFKNYNESSNLNQLENQMDARLERVDARLDELENSNTTNLSAYLTRSEMRSEFALYQKDVDAAQKKTVNLVTVLTVLQVVIMLSAIGMYMITRKKRFEVNRQLPKFTRPKIASIEDTVVGHPQKVISQLRQLKKSVLTSNLSRDRQRELIDKIDHMYITSEQDLEDEIELIKLEDKKLFNEPKKKSSAKARRERPAKRKYSPVSRLKEVLK